MEAFSLAVSAEIWRNGLNKVRTIEVMEKESIMLERKTFVFRMKVAQPEAYHQKNISKIAISIL